MEIRSQPPSRSAVPDPADEERDAPARTVARLVVDAGGAPLGAAEAVDALRAGASLLAPRDDLHPIRLTGPDRIDFLHGQISAPVRGRPPGSFTAGLLLDHRGHARAQLGVAIRDEDLFVAVHAGAGGHVEAELRRHIVFDQVELTPLPRALGSFTLVAADVVLAALGWTSPAEGAFTEVPFADARLLLHREVAAPPGSVTVHALRRQLPDAVEALLAEGAQAIEADAFTTLRVAAGVPLAPLDAGAGVLPQEAGLEPLVSYTKGCYLGQEIMARIEARGRLKRALAGVRLEPPAGVPAESVEASSAAADAGRAAPPTPGSQVAVGDRTAGRLGSVVRHPAHGWIALAVLRDDVPAEAELDASGWRARRVDLPFDPRVAPRAEPRGS